MATSRLAKRIAIHAFFGALECSLLTSLLLLLLVTDAAWVLGLSAFLISWLVGMLSRPRRLPMPDSKWTRAGFLAAALIFLLVAFASGKGGPAATSGEPILAERPHYYLARGGIHHEVQRWRYLTVAAGFATLWHLVGMSIVAMQWRAQVQKPDKMQDAVPPNPSLQRTSPGRSPGFGR